MRVLSYGGGTQSAALALMAAAGDLPRLDAVIFADTGGELDETYAYADYVAEHLDRADIPFLRATAGNLEADLLAADRVIGRNPTPPVHVANPDGSKGRIGAYRCSYDYKRRVVTTATKRLCGGRGAWKRTTVEQWIGYSTDEIGRCKSDDECRCGANRLRHPTERCETFDPWRVNRWPLLDLGFRRADTIRWFAEHGHPTPPRSACWFCPNQGNARWRMLRDEHPDKFERACQLDESLRDDPSWNQRGKNEFHGTMFIHGSLIPLRDADLRSSSEHAAAAGQEGLFDEDALALDCNAGVCFT